MAFPYIKVGLLARKGFRKWRESKRTTKLQERPPVFKGKLTYSAVLGIVAPVLASLLGFEILPEDLVPFWQAAMSAVALFGRWRATR